MSYANACFAQADGAKGAKAGACKAPKAAKKGGGKKKIAAKAKGGKKKKMLILARTDAKANGPHNVRPVRLSPGTVNFIFCVAESG